MRNMIAVPQNHNFHSQIKLINVIHPRVITLCI